MWVGGEKLIQWYNVEAVIFIPIRKHLFFNNWNLRSPPPSLFLFLLPSSSSSSPPILPPLLLLLLLSSLYQFSWILMIMTQKVPKLEQNLWYLCIKNVPYN